MSVPVSQLAELERLMVRVRRQQIPDGPYAGTRPLSGASFEGPDNWLLALLEAWSEVGQVIGFYEARLRAEGYLATAQEEVSVYELIRLLGYPSRPGVASAAWVAYGVGGSKEIPEQIEIPRGARIQSAPLGNQLPQTFELSTALVARAEWSELEPAVTTVTVSAQVAADAKAVTLEGARTRLKRGAPLLLLGELAGESRRYLRTLDKVEVATGGSGGSTTAVSWQEALDPDAAGSTLERPEVFSLAGTARLFGYNAVPWKDLPLDSKRQQRSILGGVLISSDRGGSWQGTNDGLPALPVNVMIYAAGGLLAATKSGLYALESGSWQLRDDGLGKTALQSLIDTSAGSLFAGSSDGRVYRSTDAGSSWELLQGSLGRPSRLASLLPARWRPPPQLVRLPRGPVRALAVDRHGALLAAGDTGVFASRRVDGVWSPCNRGLPGVDPKTGFAGLAVRALAADDQGICCGTDKGVFEARRTGAKWRPASRGLPGYDASSGTAKLKVLSLLVWFDRRRQERHLFAGTERGIYRRVGDGNWRSANVGLPGTDPLARSAAVAVHALALSTDHATVGPWLWAGTEQGPYRSADLGEGWLPLDTGQPQAPVSAVAADGAAVAAATPLDGFAVEQWPDFFLEDGALDLAKVETQAVPGGWVVLERSSEESSAASAPGPDVAILPILDATVVRRTAYGLSALVTRLTVPADVSLRGFGLRDTTVLLDSRSLPLSSVEAPQLAPLGPTRIPLSESLVEPLPPQRPLTVSGQPIRAQLPAATVAAGTDGAGADGAARPVTSAEDPVTVLSAPQPVAAPDGQAAGGDGGWLEMTVRLVSGDEEQVLAPEGEITWLSSAADASTINELAWVAGSEEAAGATAHPGSEIVLVSPLANAFDPQTVTLRANVAQALQGETVEQTLGSGDSRRANQSFSLTNVPLTYEPAATAAGLRSTLEVRVDGILWDELLSFESAGPDERGYVIGNDLSGRPLIHFGDGTHGSRLPTGTNNVQATYRTGLWATPLESGQLSLLRTRPLGARIVTNPLPSPGATPAETLEGLRRRAPRSTRPLARIVSLTDFEDFVLTYPGIARARLTALATPSGELLQITVAGIGGQPIAATSNLYRQLVTAVATVRLPGQRLSVGSYRPLHWRLSARVRTDPAEVAATVIARVRAALSSAYGFEQARFGQVLASSQVLTLIHGVPGVVDVELTAFYPAGEPPRVLDSLHARSASWNGGDVQPAELLLLDDPAGVKLTAVGDASAKERP